MWRCRPPPEDRPCRSPARRSAGEGSTLCSARRGSVSGSMYHEACLGWLGSDEGKESGESLMYRKQWKMYNEFIVVGNFLQFEILEQNFSNPKPLLDGLEFPCL